MYSVREGGRGFRNRRWMIAMVLNARHETRFGRPQTGKGKKKIMRYHFNLLAVIIYGSYHSHVTTFTYWTLPYMEVTTHAMRYHLYLCDVTM